MRRLLELEEAQRRLWELVEPVREQERVDIWEADGRVLAEDVRAARDVPGFPRAAMDGYAVRAEDTYGATPLRPRRLRCLGRVEVDAASAPEVVPGACLAVATGSPLPPGAEAVVMVEDTEREGDEVVVYRPVHPGEHVSQAGSDIPRGALALRRGTPLNPARVGVLAALGVRAVSVYRRPRVGILSTGDELRDPGQELPAGAVYDVNAYTLAALVRRHGGVPLRFGPVPDDLDRLRVALGRAAEASDLVAVSGGSSVGERDLLLAALGEEVCFHGLALKPGKPTLAARLRGRLVLGLPGYPTSCLTNAYLLLVPLLRRMAHLPPLEPRRTLAPLDRRITSPLGRRQILPVRLREGRLQPVFKESGAITSLAEAEGYVEIPAEVELVERGEVLEMRWFD